MKSGNKEMHSRFNSYTDETLASMAQKGDSQAEECLIRRYMDEIREKCHIYFIAGADSEDVIQEGMIGLFKAIQSFECGKEAAFRTYANICINRQIISAIRKASRQKHEPLNNSISLDIRDDGDRMLGYADTPEDILMEKNLSDIIWDAGSSVLSSFEKKVLREYLAGQSYSDIAEKLGRNTKSIDNAMQRIRKKVTVQIAN